VRGTNETFVEMGAPAIRRRLAPLDPDGGPGRQGRRAARFARDHAADSLHRRRMPAEQIEFAWNGYRPPGRDLEALAISPKASAGKEAVVVGPCGNAADVLPSGRAASYGRS